MPKKKAPKIRPEFHHIALECGHVWGMGKNLTPEVVKCPRCGEEKRVLHIFPW